MLSIERREQIVRLLTEQKSVTVEELAKNLQVSNATIRRDLAQMEKERLIKRSHGGAVLFRPGYDEDSVLLREKEHAKQKKIIGELAAEFLKDHDTLFVDSSSTAGAVIPFVKNFADISVITNGMKNAFYLSEHTKAKIYLAGGVIHNHSNSVLGMDAVEYLSKMHADIAIVSCGGFSLENEITESSCDQGHLKRVMVQNSKTKLLLCDSSKFGVTCLCRSFKLEEIDYLITDKKPAEEYLEKASLCGCKILYPERNKRH